jgi:hypothetical protein
MTSSKEATSATHLTVAKGFIPFWSRRATMFFWSAPPRHISSRISLVGRFMQCEGIFCEMKRPSPGKGGGDTIKVLAGMALFERAGRCLHGDSL